MHSIFNRTGGFSNFVRTSPVTVLFLLVNTGMLIATIIIGGMVWDTTTLMDLGAIFTPNIQDGEWWRLLTGSILHGDYLHFFSNMVLGLIVLGSGLERVIGSTKFFLVYLFSTIFSSFTIYFWDLITGTYYVTIGASGAIFGVLGLLFYISFARQDLITEEDIRGIRTYGILNIVLSFMNSGVSVSGHLGGFVAGLLIGLLFLRTKPKKVIDEFDWSEYNVH